MKNNGFTIVELVIVIAVVAILAAVLIPTFAGIVKQANISSDIQTARNMGVILAGVKPQNPYDAVEALKANGFERLHPKTKFYSFYWIESLNVVVLTDEGIRPIFPEEMVNAIFKEGDWHDLTATYQEKEQSVTTEPPISPEPPDDPTQCLVTYEVNNKDYLDLDQCVFTDTVTKGERFSFTLAPKNENYVITRVLIVMLDGEKENKREFTNRDPITDRMEFVLDNATGDIKVSITVEPPESVNVTFTCNKPEYLKEVPENTTVEYGKSYSFQLTPADGGQYWITKITIYKGGKQLKTLYPNPGASYGFGDIDMTEDLEINIHVVKYCTVEFVGENIKDSFYTRNGLKVEWGIGALFEADDLRERFIPDGYEIESVTVKMGDKTLTDAYDPVKQILHLRSITDNITVTFEFKEKSN